MVASDFTPEEELLIENEFQALLSDYAHTRHRQKVDIITLQLEAFADFSLFEGVDGIDFQRAYETYHGIEAESYSGTLLTNLMYLRRI